MRKSIIVFAAGTVVAAAYGYSPAHDAIRDLVAATRSAPVPAPAAAPTLAPQAEPPTRVFSSDQPLLAPPAGPSPAPVTAPATAFIAPPVPTDANALAPPVRRLSSSRPADDEARQELVRDLQRELKRVGCYEGEINGTWSPAAKKSMASFTERVNATLPLDEPDYILLTLLQGHKARVCSPSCPSGQALSNAGHCVPNGIVARNDRETVSQPAPTKVRPYQSDKKQAATAGSSWATVVAPAPVTQQSRDATSVVPEPVEAPRSPLPGRMAIGAPIETPVTARSERDVLRAEMAKRKAELAVAEAQRAATAETERQARIAAAEAKKAARAPSPKIAARSGAKAPPATVATAVAKPERAPEPQPLPGPAMQLAAPATPRPKLEKQVRLPPETKRPKVTARTQSPLGPSGQQQVYSGPVVIVAPGPLPPPRPAYVPQPSRWTRNIFGDFSRMR